MVVLDPFLGAGTTLVACKKLDINGLGVELDKTYCEMTLEILENYV
jgi:site-specific DNA-methyltransferase (adenine-specific)